jgi:hypothetical protein
MMVEPLKDGFTRRRMKKKVLHQPDTLEFFSREQEKQISMPTILRNYHKIQFLLPIRSRLTTENSFLTLLV